MGNNATTDKGVELCDGNCNECELLRTPNAKILTNIFNKLYDKFGSGVYSIVQSKCPNLTCCYDCHIDDFCHVEGCELIDEETAE
jgi:hypothetical protein